MVVSLCWPSITMYPWLSSCSNRDHHWSWQNATTKDYITEPRIWLVKADPKIIESSSKNLPNIYQPFTNDLPKIRPYLAFYLLKFTKDLPKTYQRFTKSTKHLPKAVRYFFNLPNIYQQFTKDLPKIRPYLAFYLLKTYQGFTKDLPNLPNTYQKL